MRKRETTVKCSVVSGTKYMPGHGVLLSLSEENFLSSVCSYHVRSWSWDSTGSFLVQLKHPMATIHSPALSSTPQVYTRYPHHVQHTRASVRNEGAPASGSRQINSYTGSSSRGDRCELSPRGAFHQRGGLGQFLKPLWTSVSSSGDGA